MTTRDARSAARKRPPTAADTETLSYEQARAELAGVVERLEGAGVSLEDALALWQRGEKLAEVCQRWLDGARRQVEAARSDRAASSTD